MVGGKHRLVYRRPFGARLDGFIIYQQFGNQRFLYGGVLLDFAWVEVCQSAFRTQIKYASLVLEVCAPCEIVGQ